MGTTMSDEDPEQDNKDANQYLAMGAGIGVYGAVTAVVGAAACPLCVVAAPAFLGLGVYKKWRAKRAASAELAPDHARQTKEPVDV